MTITLKIYCNDIFDYNIPEKINFIYFYNKKVNKLSITNK